MTSEQPRWNQKAIGEWMDREIGAINAAVIGAHILAELSELFQLLTEDPNGLGLSTADAAARVQIHLFWLAHRCNFDLLGGSTKLMDTLPTGGEADRAQVHL